MSVAITAQMASQGALDLLAVGRTDSSLAADIALAHNSTTALTISVGRSNYAAAMILLGLIAIFCYWPFIEATWERLVATVALGIGAMGILATASKSQVISLAVVFLVAAVIGMASRREGSEKGRLLAVVLLGALLFAGLAASWTYLGAVFAPFQQTGTSAYGTVGRRFEIWDSALATIKESPLFGVGVFDLELRTPVLVYPTAHNTILQVAAETGLPGLLIYLRLFWAPIQRTRKQVRAAAIVLVSGLFVAGLAESTLRTGPYDFVAWLLVGSVVGLATAWSESPSVSINATEAVPAPPQRPHLTSAGRAIR